jgi:hypothetical protein
MKSYHWLLNDSGPEFLNGEASGIAVSPSGCSSTLSENPSAGPCFFFSTSKASARNGMAGPELRFRAAAREFVALGDVRRFQQSQESTRMRLRDFALSAPPISIYNRLWKPRRSFGGLLLEDERRRRKTGLRCGGAFWSRPTRIDVGWRPLCERSTAQFILFPRDAPRHRPTRRTIDTLLSPVSGRARTRDLWVSRKRCQPESEEGFAMIAPRRQIISLRLLLMRWICCRDDSSLSTQTPSASSSGSAWPEADESRL